MSRVVIHRIASILAAILAFGLDQACVAQQPDDFAHSVAPILKKHCVPCHGGREAKGSFSLNTRQLLLDSGHVVSGKPNESQLLELIRSADPKTQMPPKDRERLTAQEIATLEKWISGGLPWDDGFTFAPVAYEPPLKPRRPELPAAVLNRANPIDRILDNELTQQGKPLPPDVDDLTFLRRVSMDLVGLLPTPEEQGAFLRDTSPEKRKAIVRELLADDIAYADHWLTFYNDLLRNDYSGTGFITGGRQQISGWLYEALLTNKPFDQFARELIAPASGASQGYIDGIRWRGEVSAGQTVEIQFAQSVAQSFLGINMKCASCHDSFIDRWKLDEAYGLAAIYSDRPLEIHRCDKPIGRQAVAAWMFPEIGQIDATAPRPARLQQLASLMTHPDNGRFPRTIVNRLWYKLMGRGIVHPLDAMQSPPWNQDLLDQLAVELTDRKYDLREILFLIATSHAYQSPTMIRTGDAAASATGWGRPVARRMTAEQFIDAVWQLTDSAPVAMDAPVLRARPRADGQKSLEMTAQWIWSDSAAEGKAPADGEKISLRRTFVLDDDVQGGGAVMTCDNGFVLYVNGREVDRSDDWTQPRAISLRPHLKKGENTILVVASNAGNSPNPAAFVFQAQLKLANGNDVTWTSDDSWEWSAKVAPSKEGRSGMPGGPWKKVTIVPALDVWNQTMQGTGRNLLSQLAGGELRMVRASLMKNDFLMRSLGRPHREQIVSMRPDELTTLEAIDLSNGSVLAGYLATGGRLLKERWQDDREGLVDHIFRFALTRVPTAEEKAAMLDSLSQDPSQEQIEDLLWAVMMSPEFLMIR